MSDLISRQAAIDALMPIYKSASLRNRNVFSTARKCMAAIEDLPSAQPESPIKEIIYCKDCIHHFYDGDIPYCNQIDYGYGWEDDDFCSFAEKAKRGGKR